MPRGTTLRTRARELAGTLTVVQLRELAEALAQEAEKPRMDQRTYNRLERSLRSLYAQVEAAEEEMASVLTEAGRSNDEINAEFQRLRRAGAPPKRARRKAAQV